MPNRKMMMHGKYITKEDVNRMAAKIEMTRVELNRIGKSCQLADVDIVKMSQELDEIIVEYMRQQLQTMKSNKPTAASNRLSVDICTKPDSH